MRSDRIGRDIIFHKPYRVIVPKEGEEDSHIPIQQNGTTWYTDGSKTEQSTGAGATNRDPDCEISINLGNYATVFQAEITAISACTQEMTRRSYTNKRIQIISDSQAALKALGAVEIHSQALVGVLKLDDNTLDVERQIIQVQSFVVHPDYEGGVNPNDIALLKLSSPVTYNKLVQPISLPGKEEETSGEVVLSGWGSTGGIIFPSMPNNLQKVNIPIVEINECKSALDALLSSGTSPLDLKANICTGPLTGGISACSGDSGGPLASKQGVIGVVSWGVMPCGSAGAPSVYTKVSHYVDWIEKNVDEPLA
ncbi:hypothetical protein NQ318_014098 [Aromia moschata]|uniref:Peptidase S1 domain-containing protein n=1 Tax=Aromia moschata TaxID=1265417 RepID=A0AAV8YYU0_9CUCU|nr:hypothetical protein NQ318_014098 [Aromia moschata]